MHKVDFPKLDLSEQNCILFLRFIKAQCGKLQPVMVDQSFLSPLVLNADGLTGVDIIVVKLAAFMMFKNDLQYLRLMWKEIEMIK